MILLGNKTPRRKKRMCIKISKSLLEEFLFQNKVDITYIIIDPATGIISIYIDGAGYETVEGQRLAEVDLEQAIRAIKEAIKE